MLIRFRHALARLKGKPIGAIDALPSQQKGFTLVELLIAIAILGIIAVSAVSPYRQWNANRQLIRTARGLYSHMQSAKLEAVRNNCNIVVSFALPNSYQVFRDDGGTANFGAGNDVWDATEAIIVSQNMPNNISMLIDGVEFSGTTTPGFTSRALPILGRTGSVVFQRNGETHRWYRVGIRAAGLVEMQVSSDSTDGTDGTWGDI